MAKRDIGSEILEGLGDFIAWRAGKRSLKTTKVDLPKAADVPDIRAKLRLSQTEFADFMNVPVGTVRNWEQQRREPRGPARVLLRVAGACPEAVLGALTVTQTRRIAMKRAAPSRATAPARIAERKPAKAAAPAASSGKSVGRTTNRPR